MFQFRLPVLCARSFTFSAVTLKIVWAVAWVGALVFRSCVVAMKTPYSRCHTVSVPPCQEENCQDFALSCTAWRPLLPVRPVDGKNKVERWANRISPLHIVIFITQRFPQQCTDTFASVCLMWLVRGLHWPTPECACFTVTHSSVTENRWLTQRWLTVTTPVCIYTMSFLGLMTLCAWEPTRACRLCLLPRWEEKQGRSGFSVHIWLLCVYLSAS